MPELPEVETIKRQLNNVIVGKKRKSRGLKSTSSSSPKRIKSVEILEPRLIKVSLKSFKKAVIGATIKAIRRRAKLLIIDLSDGHSLLIHLKMSGQLIYQPARHPELDSESHKHTRVVYNFTDGSKLLHNDLRKFGFVKLVETKEVLKYLEKERYGPEPLEKNFAPKNFKTLLVNQSRKKIKPILMEQTFIAGIGNIYADEICFYAGVKPTRIVGTLTDEEIKKLFNGIKKILREAIRYRGSSADLYLDAEGKEGEYVPRLKVYGREGEKCPRCGGIVERIKIGGRGAHFCPRCQK